MKKTFILSVTFAIIIGFLTVGTVHAQGILEGQWFKGRINIVNKWLTASGQIETDKVRLPVFIFFENPVANDCDGFTYAANLVTDIDGDGAVELIDTDIFATCGTNEEGAVAGFIFTEPNNLNDVTFLYNGKLIKGKKFVSQGCMVLVDAPDDLTGIIASEAISRNCKVSLTRIDCIKLRFDPSELGLPPCPAP